MLNILTSAWVPVLMPDGTHLKQSPIDIANGSAVEVAHPRSDFSALITELLVELCQTLAAPVTSAELQELHRARTPLDLSRFERAAANFNLFGDGPRFLQSPEPLGKEAPSNGLVFEAPAAKTKDLNKDFYVGRDEFQAICHHCAPALLMLNQAHARVGGSGYRTSLRGGSALTVLLRGKTLAETIRLNLLSTEHFLSKYSLEGAPLDVLPWQSAQTFTSRNPTPADLGAYACLWWMPQALRLTSRTNAENAPCSLCGEVHPEILGTTMHKAATVASAPGGLYHPRTAWAEKKDAADLLPVLTPPSGYLLREWVALNLGGGRPGTELAALSGLGRAAKRNMQLWAFGPRCEKHVFSRWHDEVVPTLVHEELTASELRGATLSLLEDSQAVLSLLTDALAQGKLRSASVPLLTAPAQPLTALALRCRAEMQQTLLTMDVESLSLPLDAYASFQQTIRKAALRLFDESVQYDSSDVQALECALRVRTRLLKQLKLGKPTLKPASSSKPSKTAP